MIFPARTLLACWLTVTATGAIVAHRHAPAPGGANGLGWASIATPSSGPAFPFSHGHFLFFGIEFGETQEEEGAGSGDLSRVERVVDGAASPADDGCAVPIPDPLLTVSAWASAPSNHPLAKVSDPVPAPACALTSRTRSGVLRS
jgi:hypothetical protein